MNVHNYFTSYLHNAMDMLQSPPNLYDAAIKITIDQFGFTAKVAKATVSDEIFLHLSVSSCQHGQFNVTATLYQDRIPKVSCDKSFGNYHIYVYAWKVENFNNVCKTIRLPLYCDPDSAYKTLCGPNTGRLLQATQRDPISISFSVLWVGV